MASRGRRRLGRSLVLVGVVLAVPEFYYLWVLGGALFLSLHGPGGQAAQIHVHLNGSAWAMFIAWTVLWAVLVGWGVRLIRKSRRP
jgi:hypothetical protein